MKKKNQKLLIVIGILLLFGGVSLAYFVSKVILGGSGSSTNIKTAVINGATLNIEGILSFEDLDVLPGHKSISAIKVTATGNNELIPYNLIWKGTNTLTTPLNFTIYKTSEQLSVTSTCNKKTQIISGAQALSEECTISNIDKLGNEIASGTINKNDTKVTLAKDEFITATSTGDIKYYYVILEYPNLDEPQNYDLEGTLEGEVTVEESSIKPDINILTAYVIQEDGTYKEVDDIPQEGYQLNNEKSTCNNGAILKWDTKNKELITSNLTKSGTSCYLYFDKYVPITIDDIMATLNPKTDAPDFSTIADTDEGVYAVSDGVYGGTSYYWRGAATTNYVKFADFCWRIVRINGDKTMRLIYDGTTCHANGTNTTESIAKTSIAYNQTYNASYYVGWTQNGTQRTLIGTASNAKTELEDWYSTNIENNITYSRKIAQGKYCNDRDVGQPLSSDSGYATTWSTDGTKFKYAGVTRLWETYLPTLSCPTGDVYTLSVGLLTADEVEFAGGKNENNTAYYLYNGQKYWTMSPYNWSGSQTFVFFINALGFLGGNFTYNSNGLRPVINLRSDITFSGGNGTLDNPYVVAD